MIKAFFVLNHRSGEAHVVVFYEKYPTENEKLKCIEEVHRYCAKSVSENKGRMAGRYSRKGEKALIFEPSGVTSCGPAWGSWAERKQLSLVYTQRASVLFVACVDDFENILDAQKTIEKYIDSLNEYFENVTEFDIAQNPDRARLILDGVIQNGIDAMFDPGEVKAYMDGLDLEYGYFDKIADCSAAKVLSAFVEDEDSDEAELMNEPLSPSTS